MTTPPVPELVLYKGEWMTEKEQLRRMRMSKPRTTPYPKVICPHCYMEVGANVYARWHGDKCKGKRDV